MLVDGLPVCRSGPRRQAGPTRPAPPVPTRRVTGPTVVVQVRDYPFGGFGAPRLAVSRLGRVGGVLAPKLVGRQPADEDRRGGSRASSGGWGAPLAVVVTMEKAEDR